MADELSKDDDIDWSAIRTTEKGRVDWQPDNWKRRIVRALATPGRYSHGGDRISSRYRRIKQQSRAAFEHTTSIANVKLEEDDTDGRACLHDRTEPGLCRDGVCHDLAARLHTINPHSVVDVKAYQRDRILGIIAHLLTTRRRVNIYLFDDRLLRPGAQTATLLTEEIITRFGWERVRVWSPNLDTEIVASLRALAPQSSWLTAGYGCFCACNAAWAEDIRRAGGLDVVFADCYGGFVRGARKLVADLVARRLFRRPTDVHDARPAHVMWAVSDLPDRMQHGLTVAQSALRMLGDCADVFDNDCAYTHRLVEERPYGVTMHFVAIEVRTREWLANPPPGCVTRVALHVDDEAV